MYPKSLQQWRAYMKDVLETVKTMCDHTNRHAFLRKQTVHQGRKPKTEQARLHKMLTMYRELHDRDHVIILNLLAAELNRMDETVDGLSLASIRRQIYRHLQKYGVVRHHITRVAQNTRHDQAVVNDYIQYVKEAITPGKYKSPDIVNIDETNVDFDFKAGLTIAGRGKCTRGCTTTC
jgi:hypothetical protein